MHLLAGTQAPAQPGDEAVDLGQTPGRIVIASCADTELACLAAARRALGDAAPSLRLVNLTRLRHPLSVDLWVDSVVRHAEVVILRALGGRGYWAYAIEQVATGCRESGALLAVLPGDERDDPGLDGWSTAPPERVATIRAWLTHGGVENATALLRDLAGLAADPPRPVAPAGLLRPASLDDMRDRPRALIVAYRALVQAGATAPLEALADALETRGLEPVVAWVTSLKDKASAALIDTTIRLARPDILLATTGFAVGDADPLAVADAPVLQVVLASTDEATWQASTAGLAPSDLAMSVVLPEIDGRISSRAVAFKSTRRFDPDCECPLIEPVPRPDRIAFVADLAAAWVTLRRTSRDQRRLALVLANYPTRDGRLANGVGLDTPASTIAILAALERVGYAVGDRPMDGDSLIRRLLRGPTNDAAALPAREIDERWSLADYAVAFASLPAPLRDAVIARWGRPEADPFVVDGAFALAVLRCGNVVIGLQPSRGYDLDPATTWHDPALVPPHRYVAFYLWLRHGFGAQALVHVGKHGNAEWLPGKSTALSAECWPEAVLGPLPHLYPFIVNDPGEGSAAKRRGQAVIVDHLTPPLTRAGAHPALAELETKLDEYAQAQALDPRRAAPLRREILDLARHLRLDRDLELAPDTADDAALVAFDRHLCELKELQIRDGLHVLGTSPSGAERADLLLALVRSPRGERDADASILRALAADLGLGAFDPLTCDLSEPWQGPRPHALSGDEPWRNNGDTVERLGDLAGALLAGAKPPDPAWSRTSAVLATVSERIAPALDHSGAAEIAALLAGLDGRRVAPGPAGAPTRGRPDVLPTGRNFHSVDSRAVPTPTAWQLGWRSAGLVVEHYRQTHGEWPRRIALSAWGTATMRTGGDDVAQALALLGCRPVWDATSGRVTGVELLSADVLGRPRVDVTLRVSGMFRDAFPAQIELVDDAVRAVAALDESAEVNPIAAAVAADIQCLIASGAEPASARREASFRVFGSAPGAYGAGLQTLIDNGNWQGDGELATAFLAWGGWAYGRGTSGAEAKSALSERLATTELVLHNQDNREHDLLDSDDYYQFEGGLAATVRHLSGRQPATFHTDHALPERPVVRTLAQEISRTVRGRATHPRWIAGVMRHGYKGAFEIAATVDYLFAFAATARVVEDHHFDQLFDAYLADETVRGFLAEANPDALREIARRFEEAVARGLWRPASNSAHGLLAELAGTR